jgi:hypothetical protein
MSPQVTPIQPAAFPRQHPTPGLTRMTFPNVPRPAHTRQISPFVPLPSHTQ